MRVWNSCCRTALLHKQRLDPLDARYQRSGSAFGKDFHPVATFQVPPVLNAEVCSPNGLSIGWFNFVTMGILTRRKDTFDLPTIANDLPGEVCYLRR